MPSKDRRDKMINSRTKKLGYGQSDDPVNNAARPFHFGPKSKGQAMKKSRADTFTTDERAGGNLVDDYELPGEV